MMANNVVPGAAVTTSPSGFMNMERFKEWFHFFSQSVPASIPRQILDGCGSHYSARSKIHNMISELVNEDGNGYFNISKGDVIKVACLTWGGANVGRDLERGFKACGLFPLALAKMKARLATFTRNGAPRHVQLAA
ncbi:hypothetical protein PR003_g8338 [Phytophthora rubi]|uniref:DDE-1 domain-containing protein n=1 Tax=Phytophthora rubi TaxID=129364 RepID=A0A6A4FJ69_9STRA|nr:hypothetical protein PR002_g8144 [Phytophthora rubi]KAE9344678.1 hypothetical protein PR003_g8338 [Phytophthora rubi]